MQLLSTLGKSVNFGVSLILVIIAIGLALIALPFWGNKSLIVRSGSMQPTINVGDLIVVSPNSLINSPVPAITAKYKVGDIVAFQESTSPETIVTHRVIGAEIKDGQVMYLTKGDANSVADQTMINEKNIIGRSQLTIPHVGKVFAFTKSKVGYPLLIILPALLVILLEINNIFKELGKKKFLMRGSLRDKMNINSLHVFIPFIAFALIFQNSHSFFLDTATSQDNVFQAAESFCAPTSENGPFYADEVISSVQGLRKDGSAVLPERSNPADVLGVPNGVGSPSSGFFALGYGGIIKVSFAGPVVDVSGDDLSFHEITNGRSTYPLEKATVAVSVDGTTWFDLTPEASSEPPGDGVVFLDISSNVSAPDQINFVRITDTTDASLNPDPFSDGYDLDAVDATSLCLPSEPIEEIPPQTGGLVINEVMFDPPNTNACGSENDAEWVEIYNPTTSGINLDTWLVGDTLFTEDLPNVTLPAGGFAIVSDCTQANFITIWPIPAGTIYIDNPGAIGNGFNNGGEHVRLLNGATLIDSVSYGTNTDAFSPSVSAPVSDHSIERSPDGVDTDTAADFVDRTIPTPGN